MWKLILVIAIVCTMTTDAANKKRKRYAGGYASSGSAGGYAGGGSSGGYSGGYAGGYGGASSGAGSYAGGGDYGNGGYAGTGFDYAPNFGFGFIDPYEFHQQLTAQILAQHAAQNNALSSTYTSGDAFVSADASSYPDDDNQIYQQQFAQQQAYFDAIRRQSQHNKGYKTNRYAPSYASASGSIGPGGYHQSAHINPENPASPNIVNRFSTDSGPGGYKGVSVSSFSSSSDIDGKRTSHRGAQTTINDNGKITTYKVHS